MNTFRKLGWLLRLSRTLQEAADGLLVAGVLFHLRGGPVRRLRVLAGRLRDRVRRELYDPQLSVLVDGKEALPFDPELNRLLEDAGMVVRRDGRWYTAWERLGRGKRGTWIRKVI